MTLLDNKSLNSLLWIGDTGGLTGYGGAPSYTGSEKLRRLGLAVSPIGKTGLYHLTRQGRELYAHYRAARHTQARRSR